MEIKEEDLYEPVKTYLEEQGYSVNAEVMHCDITATLNDELIVVELKKNFSLKLIYQAIDRQNFSDSVYVAVPVISRSEYPANFKHMCRLLKRLEIGLILVHFLKVKQRVELVLHPRPYERQRQSKRRQSIIRETSMRVMEMNTGGSRGAKKITLYRQEALEIAVCLDLVGSSTPKNLVSLGCSDKSQTILNNNYYGWFEKISRGVYSLHSSGKKALKSYRELTDHFRQKHSQLANK